DRAFPIRDEAGAPVYVAGIAEDVTEQTRAEQALRESEARLRIALDTSGLGSWESNPQTGEIDCTTRCKTDLGLGPDAVLNHDVLLERVHPDDRASVIETGHRAVETRG